jgi:mRNA-degrading endonuclease RelE of RelBE toxin-antitoxin system
VKVALLPQAAADLDGLAEPLFSQVLKRLQALSRYPHLGPTLSGPLSGYRATVVGHFRVVYKASAKTILVCYVRDFRRA